MLIHINVNESIYIYVSRFINMYMHVDNARKSYIMKQRRYLSNTYNKCIILLWFCLGRLRF